MKYNWFYNPFNKYKYIVIRSNSMFAMIGMWGKRMNDSEIILSIYNANEALYYLKKELEV